MDAVQKAWSTYLPDPIAHNACIACRRVSMAELPMFFVCAVPAGDLVLVDAVQEARPRFLLDFVAPWVVWNHIVLRLGDSPDGR